VEIILVLSKTLTNLQKPEYERARLALRGVAEQAPYALTTQKSALTEIVVELLGPLPMVRSRAISFFDNVLRAE
jgi:hypothetical protein